jgi:regulator of ribonuclease activity A
MLTTADLCDEFGDEVEVAAPLLRDFGGRRAFYGPIVTVEVNDDNTSVRQVLATPGEGCVLVVDGGASTRCALVGDRLAALAVENGWAGIVVNGCIRDSEAIAAMPIGVKALATMPRKSEKRGPGRHDVPVSFAGVTFTPGHHLYADADGLLVAPRALPIT